MPLFSAVTADHIHLALEEYDALGGEAFRDRYGFGPSREYVLLHDGRSYDSKAILGVALRHATGSPATSEDFNGGRNGAVKVLADLGFEVTEPTGIDASELGAEEALSAWAEAAREELQDTAKHYHAVITAKALGASIQARSGIRTSRPVHYWLGDVLARVGRECASHKEPLLSSLCVNASGSVGEAYGDAVAELTGKRPADLDVHAADERLRCYQQYDAAGLPSDGGRRALTTQLSESRARARKKYHAEKAVPLCPTCQMALPATGRCDNCD